MVIQLEQWATETPFHQGGTETFGYFISYIETLFFFLN